jgi:hypothetical protein
VCNRGMGQLEDQGAAGEERDGRLVVDPSDQRFPGNVVGHSLMSVPSRSWQDLALT